MEIAEKIAAQQERAVRAEVAAARAKYLYVEPLVAGAQDLIDLLANEEERFMFGLAELDTCIRGVGKGELCYLTGRAYSGKTFLVQNAILRQPNHHVLWLTPDETAAAVHCRLVSLIHGLDYDELESRAKAGDSRVKQLIWSTAQESFPHLIVSARSLTFAEMTVALSEAQDIWQAPCQTVVIDYLDLLPGQIDYNGTKRKSVELKAWVKDRDVASVTIHQPKRGGASRGTSIGMDDMANAGETEATYVLGVHRERDNYERGVDDEHRLRHRNTVSITLSKNKRPPGRHGSWEFFMHPSTGRIRGLAPEDLIVPGVEIPDMATAIAHRARWQSELPQPFLHVVS